MRTKIEEALKQAMREGDKTALSTLRLVLAAIKDRDIVARGREGADVIDKGEIISLLQSMIKQRHESIELYNKAGRQELAQREGEEIEVIKRFLPEQMTDAEMEAVVMEMIEKNKATNLKAMGPVMAQLREKYAGKMNFAKAGIIARQKLSADKN